VQQAWELGAGMDAWYDGVGKVYKAWSQALAEHGLDWNSPVPKVEDILAWDFIDTGIDKAWLVADYARALATTVVPDCSFEGCSHCGICGEDFGANLSLPIPAMPKAYTEKSVVPKERYRLQVRFGKLDELRFIGHLDLIRLFERACRRAQLPMHFSEGFHPLPKISVATALPLGMTSTAEIAEFELYREVATQEFLLQLQAQLPLEIPLFTAEVVESNAPHAGAVLKEVGYDLTFNGGEDWTQLVDSLRNSPKLFVQRTHRKSGKVWPLDVRFWLHELELLKVMNQAAVLRYRSSYTKDGATIKPSDLEQLVQAEYRVIAGEELPIQLVHSHRCYLN
jgi:radical SAM-linked protein